MALLTSIAENQKNQDMKAKYKLTVGVVIATFAVTAASLSVDPAKKTVTPVEQYLEEDILLLSKANQCSRQQAIELLELASTFPAKSHHESNPNEE